MLNENIGFFAESRAGHDKGKVFVIINASNEYVYLADGKSRTIANPKRKNIKHIQIIKKDVDEKIRKKLLNNETVSNEELKYVLKERFRCLCQSQI